MKKKTFLLLAMISFLMFVIAIMICTYLENNPLITLSSAELSWIPAIIGIIFGYTSIWLFLKGIGILAKSIPMTNKYKGKHTFEIKDAVACIEVTIEETEKTYFKNLTIAKGFYKHLEEMGIVPALYIRKEIHPLYTGDLKYKIERVW